jgi:hypothetical protein
VFKCSAKLEMTCNTISDCGRICTTMESLHLSEIVIFPRLYANKFRRICCAHIFYVLCSIVNTFANDLKVKLKVLFHTKYK